MARGPRRSLSFPLHDFLYKGGMENKNEGDYMRTSKKVTAISSDMKKLKTILRQIPKERLPIAQSLYNELVFMQTTLEALKTQVNEEGPTAMFKQGRQEFLRNIQR